MRKHIYLIFALLVTCGNSSEESTTTTVQETTTTTVQESTTTTTNTTTTTTTTTTIPIKNLITNFSLENTIGGYIAATATYDLKWDSFNIETINEQKEVCSYTLNENPFDYSRLLFSPDKLCPSGIYTISKIQITYQNDVFEFTADSNQSTTKNTIICCNFEDVFNWKVEIFNSKSLNCPNGTYKIYDDVYCKKTFPKIKYLNLSENENNEIVLSYEFEYEENNYIDKDSRLTIKIGSNNSDIRYFITVENDSTESYALFSGNIFKDTIKFSKDDLSLELNKKYNLSVREIYFSERDRSMYINGCGISLDYSKSQLLIDNKSYYIFSSSYMTSRAMPHPKCNYDNYDLLLTSSNMLIDGRELKPSVYIYFNDELNFFNEIEVYK